MAQGAPRPCPRPGCGRLVPFGGQCPVHPVRTGTFSDSRRGSRQSRGYDAEWERMRKIVLSRDQGLCQPCLLGISFVPTDRPHPELPGLWCKPSHVARARQVDHKVSKAHARQLGWSREQTDDERNLWSICNDCHGPKTQIEAQGGGGVGMFSRLLAGPAP
jgi:5-methylcytosine-specific restriction protein A